MSRLPPLARFLLLVLGTTGPILLLLTVFMPRGFAGSYPVFVLLAAVLLFLAAAALEASVAVNCAVVAAFWAAISAVNVLYPGEAPGRGERIWRAQVVIIGLCAVHAGLQSAACLLLARSRRGPR